MRSMSPCPYAEEATATNADSMAMAGTTIMYTIASGVENIVSPSEPAQIMMIMFSTASMP